jgi:hypothetical protein
LLKTLLLVRRPVSRPPRSNGKNTNQPHSILFIQQPAKKSFLLLASAALIESSTKNNRSGGRRI